MRIGYFVVSLVNMLWDHILFPFPSLLHLVTDLAAQGLSQNWLKETWPIANQSLKVSTLVFQGMHSKGGIRMKSAK